MRVKVSSILIAMLYIIVIGCENCFYLVNADSINVAGVMNYTDIFVLLAGLFFVIVFQHYKDYPTPRFKFKWIIYGVILLSVISSIQSQNLYGQGFITGLRPQRFWIVWGMLYFPLRKLLYIKKITVDDIVKMVFFIGTCEIVLYSLQYILGNRLTFLYVGSNVRYGEMRYYFYNIFLRLLLFINLDRIFNKKKVIQSCVYVVAILFVLMVVGKMRMTSLATLLAIVFGIFIWRKGGTTKVGIIIAATFIGVVLFNTPIVQDTISTLTEIQNGTVSSLNITLRQSGHELYLRSLSAHPIVGCGFISALNATASTAAGLNQSILLVDNGLWAFVFMYGILGGIWLLDMFWTFLHNGWKISRKYNIYFMMLAPLGWLIAGQTEAHWFWDNGFICVTLILSIMEEYLTSKDEIISNVLQ